MDIEKLRVSKGKIIVFTIKDGDYCELAVSTGIWARDTQLAKALWGVVDWLDNFVVECDADIPTIELIAQMVNHKLKEAGIERPKGDATQLGGHCV